jgi:hypothetical protein
MVNASGRGAAVTDFTPEFATADGYAEVGRPLFLGLDPLLLALIAALIFIAGLIGWAVANMGRREDDPDEVAKAIHARILKASKAALSSESDRMVERSRALKKTVDELLGDVSKLGHGLHGPMTQIQNALDGKRPPAKAPSPAATTPATSAQNQVININVNPSAPSPSGPSGDLSGKEQTDALAVAVRAFHDWWSDADARKRELVNARAQLSRRPPGDHGHGDHDHDDHAKAAHGHDHHDDHAGSGDHHDDAPAVPIWARKKKR